MNCNRCNRLLIARDAKLMDCLDSFTRLELHCECGAVYSAFIESEDWLYGVGEDFKGSLLCERQWCRTEQGVLRWLMVENYKPCMDGGLPRCFFYRIPPNDKRPWGREFQGNGLIVNLITSLPWNQWSEMSPSESEEANR